MLLTFSKSRISDGFSIWGLYEDLYKQFFVVRGGTNYELHISNLNDFGVKCETIPSIVRFIYIGITQNLDRNNIHKFVRKAIIKGDFFIYFLVSKTVQELNSNMC